MSQKTPKINRLAQVLADKRFFWAVLALLVLQAAWIALSGRYPMAFDEDFHLGIIRLYSHHLLPFWSGQPPGADMFGAVARDPSYLYQYLMSFPYHLLTRLTNNQTIQVLVLRAINIGLFAWGLVLFRRLLARSRAHRAIVNASLLLFVLIPVVPLLAAQINYDNLFMPLLAISLLLADNVNKELTQYKRINTRDLAALIIVCLLTSLVKYAFLPIAIGIFAFLGWCFIRTYKSWRKFWLSLLFGATLIRRSIRWLLLGLLVLSLGLFAERYAVNSVRYHTPIPDCGKVLSVKRCSAYGPWIRDYTFEVTKEKTSHNPIAFSYDWVDGMWLRLFFAVDGPASNYASKGPLFLPAVSAVAFAGLGLVALILKGGAVLRRYDRQLIFLLVVSGGLYIASLYVDEFRAFIRTGQPVAINGRYLFPVLPAMILFGALAVNELLGKRDKLKITLLSLAVISFLWGGGALTYILRSQDNWYWPAPVVRTINHAVKRGLGPLTPGYSHPSEFLS